jgi:hypothetical protein
MVTENIRSYQLNNSIFFSPLYYGVPQRNKRSASANETTPSYGSNVTEVTDSVLTNTTDLPVLSRSDIVDGSTLIEAPHKEEPNATITNSERDADVPSDNTTLSISNTENTTQSLEENILPRQNQFSNPNMFDQVQGEVGTSNYDYEYTDDIAATGDGAKPNDAGEDFSENYPTNNPEPVNPALLLGKL